MMSSVLSVNGNSCIWALLGQSPHYTWTMKVNIFNLTFKNRFLSFIYLKKVKGGTTPIFQFSSTTFKELIKLLLKNMPHDFVDIVNNSYLITKWIKFIQFGHKYYLNKLVSVVYVLIFSNLIIFFNFLTPLSMNCCHSSYHKIAAKCLNPNPTLPKTLFL